MNNSNIEIPFSKTKTAITLILLVAIAGAGIFAYVSPESIDPKQADKLGILGISAAVIALASAVFVIRKWMTQKVGLLINDQGITDFSNATYDGLIEWSDVTAIKKMKVGPIQGVLVMTNSPEKYIEQGKKRHLQARKKSFKFHGTPLLIVSSRLQIKHDELEQIINEEFEKRVKLSSVES